MKHNQYYHNFSDVLNFTDDIQNSIDSLIIKINELYIGYTKALIIPKNNLDFYSIRDNQAIEYFKFGLNLIYGGLIPETSDILMNNVYEIIII